MIFEIIRGGGETDWVGERMGQPTFSRGKNWLGGIPACQTTHDSTKGACTLNFSSYV